MWLTYISFSSESVSIVEGIENCKFKRISQSGDSSNPGTVAAWRSDALTAAIFYSVLRLN